MESMNPFSTYISTIAIQILKALTPLRPRRSAIRPAVIAPSIAPIVNIDPNTEYCIDKTLDEER